MPNDQMPNYGAQTQYVSIRPSSQKCKQRDKRRKKRRKKEEKKKRREEKIKEENRREEYKIEDIERRKNRLRERESLHFTDVLSENMFKNTLNFKINFIVKLYEFFLTISPNYLAYIF